MTEGYNQSKVNVSINLSVSISLGGQRNLTLKKTQETYTIEMPKVELKNILFGKKYLYFKGDLVVKNLSTGDELVIEYPGLGWSGKKDFKASGQLKNGSGKVVWGFKGLWNEYGMFYDMESKNTTIMEKMEPVPKENEKFYFFTK